MENLNYQTGVVTDNPNIEIGFSESELVALIDAKVDESNKWYESKKYPRRRKTNESYWNGTNDSKIKRSTYDGTIYKNNIIHRDVETFIKNAVSRMPDIVVIDPNKGKKDDPNNVQAGINADDKAQEVEQWLGNRLDSDVTRRLSKQALRDNRLKYIGVWKYRYDQDKNDVCIERVKPENVVIDYSGTIPAEGFTADNVEFICEYIEEPTYVVAAKFPKKKEELLNAVSRLHYGNKSVPRSSKIKYQEYWGTFYDNDGSKLELTVWKYENIILDSQKSVYFDWTQEDLEDAAKETGATFTKRNYFAYPRKPYTFFSGENLGNSPLDDVTPVEISLPLQDTVDKRGQQITMINDWAVPKLIIASNAIDEDKANNITRDPSEVILLTSTVEDVRAAVMSVSGETAAPAMYQDFQMAIQAIDAHFSTNPVSRGETVTQESGISKQISREGDLSSADDVAQEMINRAVNEAAQWLIHLVKMFGMNPVGAAVKKEDSVTAVSLSSVDIPDDLIIEVKTNSIDKPTQRNLAMSLMGAKAIDPYSLFESLDYPNPKEMTKRLVDFLNGAPQGYATYLQDIGTNPITPAGQMSEAQPGQQMPQQGMPPELPQVPSLAPQDQPPVPLQ